MNVCFFILKRVKFKLTLPHKVLLFLLILMELFTQINIKTDKIGCYKYLAQIGCRMFFTSLKY